MSSRRIFILGLLLVQVLVIMSACCAPGQSNVGVARVDRLSTPESPLAVVEGSNKTVATSEVQATAQNTQNIDNQGLSDEVITTKFTDCMRSQGFNTPDPQLNADGTVDLPALRQSIMSDPKFNFDGVNTIAAFERCLPLLEGATFAQTPSAEDEIEFQDNMLKFAECLRVHGIAAKDPDFSADRRVAITSMLEGINLSNRRVQENIRICRDLSVGSN